jgi:cobalt-precorrin-5B (C1)-methyltransferase
MTSEPYTALRRGWTTGACATAAAKSACHAMMTGTFPDPVTITLPHGQQPAFALARQGFDGEAACAGIVKDAGDDPDVTHLALVNARVTRLAAGSGIVFAAGKGVGTVTRAGLPVAVGEPAINPVPRQMIAREIGEVCANFGVAADFHVEIGIEGGETLALKTLNPRLGIVGGLSVLGTTGIVIPYSCSSWIHAIHRGIDVARAAGLEHIAGSTGAVSEEAVQRLYELPDIALIDMGDFVGGMLKYLRQHPVPRVTIAGGVAKMTKLAQGFMDLHSRQGQADLGALADVAAGIGASAGLCERIVRANTVAEAFMLAEAEGVRLGNAIAAGARRQCETIVDNIKVDVIVFDRNGSQVGCSGP